THCLGIVSRVDRLDDSIKQLATSLEAPTTRTDLGHLANRLLRLESTLVTARRELVTLGPDGHWDALVEIAPVGSDAGARDFLFDIYDKWAKDRRVGGVVRREGPDTAQPGRA